MLYNNNSTGMDKWWKYATAVGSSYGDDEISEYGNLDLMNDNIMPPIVVVTGFVASKDFMVPNFTIIYNFIQYCNQLS